MQRLQEATFLLLILTSRVTSCLQRHCPPGWKHFNGHCYLLVSWAREFHEAEIICQDQSRDNCGESHLVSIHSLLEQEFLINEIHDKWGEKNVWTGLHVDDGDPLNPKWTDNTPVDFISYRKGYPTWETGNCAFLSARPGNLLGWDDTQCYNGAGFRFICKI